MADTYWYKQGDKPLFEQLEWDKPERRDQAGRLLIIGGSSHALSAPAKAYELVKRQGIGDVKIVLPDKTKALVGKSLPDAVFLPSTPSGELSKDGQEQLIDYAMWADSLLLPGDSGHNSQTSILFSQLLSNYSGNIILTRDAIDILINEPDLLLGREKTALVTSFGQLQKLVKSSQQTGALTHNMDLKTICDNLHTFTQNYPIQIATVHNKYLIIASHGNVSTTPLNGDDDNIWRLDYASIASCYLTWNPNKPFEALTHSAKRLISQD